MNANAPKIGDVVEAVYGNRAITAISEYGFVYGQFIEFDLPEDQICHRDSLVQTEPGCWKIR